MLFTLAAMVQPHSAIRIPYLSSVICLLLAIGYALRPLCASPVTKEEVNGTPKSSSQKIAKTTKTF